MVDSVLVSQRDSLLSQLFGDGSRLIASESTNGEVVEKVGNFIGYEIMVVVVTLLYIYWLGRYVSLHTTNRYRESRRKGIGGLEGSSSFLIDTTLPWVLFISLLSILTLRLNETLSFEPILTIPFGRLMLYVILGFSLYWLWGWGVMSLWNEDDNSEELREKIFTLKRRTLLLVTIYILPLALLAAFVSQYNLMTYILFAASLFMTIHYFVKTFLLFVREKVSSLRWFLYLCTVEVAPLVLEWFVFDYLTT